MKKQILKLAVLLAMPVIALQSCSKDEESQNTATVNMGSATISGRLTGDVVLNNGQLEGLAGVTITATINGADLVTQAAPGAIFGTKTYTATTDANGFYTLTVDVNNKPVNVTLNVPQTITVTQTKEDGTQTRSVFNRTTAVSNPSLSRGQSSVQDFVYDFSQPAILGKVTIKGKVDFRNDLCKGVSTELDSQLNVVPAGTVLIFTWENDNGNDREVIIPVKADGTYEFVTETTSSLEITIKGRKFRAELKETNNDGDCVGAQYDFTLSSQTITINRDETEFIDLEYN